MSNKIASEEYNSNFDMSLQIKLVSASTKISNDICSQNDPYIILELGDQTQKSRVIEDGGQNVTFNETFTFNSQANDLKVRFMDSDPMCDNEMGLGYLNIAQYRQSPYPQNVEVTCLSYEEPTCRVGLQIMGGGGQGGQFGGQGGNFNQGGYNQGGYNQGGNNPYNQGGNNPFNQGGYSNNGWN